MHLNVLYLIGSIVMSSVQFPLPNFNDYLLYRRDPIVKYYFVFMAAIWELE